MLDLLEKIYIYIYIYIWVMINEFLVCVFSFLGQSDMEETIFFKYSSLFRFIFSYMIAHVMRAHYVFGKFPYRRRCISF